MLSGVLLLRILLVFGSIFLAARQGKEWLYAAIIANLLFVSVFGAKLVLIGGWVTNAGNVFYAGVFFATYLLIEHYGAPAARLSVWLGLACVGLFIGTAPLVFMQAGDPSTADVDAALQALMGPFPRIALASLCAYLFAQQFNIWLYSALKERGAALWARAAGAIVLAQLLDSAVFFYIAFSGTVPSALVYESLLVGFAFKVALGLLSIPLLYASLAWRGLPSWEHVVDRFYRLERS